jgi:hypothetical protein
MDSFPFGSYAQEQYSNDSWYGQNNYLDAPLSAGLTFPSDYPQQKTAPPSASWSTAPSPFLPSSTSMWPSNEPAQQHHHLNPQDVFSAVQQIDLSRSSSMGSDSTAVDHEAQFLNHHQQQQHLHQKQQYTMMSPSHLSASPPIPSVEQQHFFSPSMVSSAMPSPALPSASLDDVNMLGISGIIPTTELGGHHHSSHNRSKSSSSSATPNSSRSNTTGSLASSRSSMSMNMGRQSNNASPTTPLTALFDFPKNPYGAPPTFGLSHSTPSLPHTSATSMALDAPSMAISLTCPQPAKRRRGRPRILRSPSDPMDGSGYQGRSSMGARQSRRQPHNMVERKYREGLNKEMERLRCTLPQLAGNKRVRRTRDDGEEYSEDEEDDDDKSIQKASKAVVLQSAVEEIEALRCHKKRLEDRVMRLEHELSEVRGLVKVETSELL